MLAGSGTLAGALRALCGGACASSPLEPFIRTESVEDSLVVAAPPPLALLTLALRDSHDACNGRATLDSASGLVSPEIWTNCGFTYGTYIFSENFSALILVCLRIAFPDTPFRMRFRMFSVIYRIYFLG